MSIQTALAWADITSPPTHAHIPSASQTVHAALQKTSGQLRQQIESEVHALNSSKTYLGHLGNRIVAWTVVVSLP